MSLGRLLDAPRASDSPETLADWLELRALLADDKDAAIQDLTSVLARGGSADAVIDYESMEYTPQTERDEPYTIAEDAFSEVENRVEACGGKEGTYPFTVGNRYLQLKDKGTESLYVFLLLLSTSSQQGNLKPKESPTKLFEEVSAIAAEGYLGRPSPFVKSRVFGFPRKDPMPTSFPRAVSDLCRTLGEGDNYRSGLPSTQKKDAGLDVVVWRDFPDNKRGKFIGFGQCATGDDWFDKAPELSLPYWVNSWMQKAPLVCPVRMFFVPHAVEKRRWDEASQKGGILFDRCRIAQLASPLPAKLVASCTAYSRSRLSQIVKK